MLEDGGLWQGLKGGFPPHDVPFQQPGETPGPEQERRLAMVLAYDGRDFAGWQLQPGARTIQGELEAALGQLCAQPVRLQASGRTDSGVHAWGQVAAFSTTSRLELGRMLRGLRSLLHPDIYVRELGPVAAGFHPQHQARAKTYDYFLFTRAEAPLFLRHFTWPLAEALDEAAMRQALDLLPGQQDLAAFASRGSEVEGSTLRRVMEARLDQVESDLWRLRLSAEGFLRHVVRNLVGSLVQVGSGRLEPGAIGEMLRAGQRLHAGPKAPPGGLYLNRVYYQREDRL